MSQKRKVLEYHRDFDILRVSKDRTVIRPKRVDNLKAIRELEEAYLNTKKESVRTALEKQLQEKVSQSLFNLDNFFGLGIDRYCGAPSMICFRGPDERGYNIYFNKYSGAVSKDSLRYQTSFKPKLNVKLLGNGNLDIGLRLKHDIEQIGLDLLLMHARFHEDEYTLKTDYEEESSIDHLIVTPVTAGVKVLDGFKRVFDMVERPGVKTDFSVLGDKEEVPEEIRKRAQELHRLALVDILLGKQE